MLSQVFISAPGVPRKHLASIMQGSQHSHSHVCNARRALSPIALWVGLSLLVHVIPAQADTPAPARFGEQIYRKTCASCHGSKGEGVAGKHDEALVGDKSVDALAKLIARTMPEDMPGTCTGDESRAVAAYIYDAFYSPAARARLNPATIAFSRLTVRQYRSAVADLIGAFRGAPTKDVETGGLSGEYFASKGFNPDKRKIERVDPAVEFSFGPNPPDPKLAGEAFAIRWNGSVIATETGEYEFVVRTENGVRLWVNAEGSSSGRDRESSDGDEPLIDEWVSSGVEPREHKKTVFLLSGRAYPVRLEMFRFKDKTASIALKWKPPHGMLRPIPAASLSKTRVPPTTVVSTPFPPDDGSAGYERGTSISKAWQQAVSAAAIQAADDVMAHVDRLAGTKPDAADRIEKLKSFCVAFAERAFRRPLVGDERAFFRDQAFEGAKEPETGVKRAVLLVLMSPRFLYPELGADVAASASANSYAIATRLALDLWDSLPDRALLDAAAAGTLNSSDAVAEHARRMLRDPRARAKVRDFLHAWLRTDKAEDLSKDSNAFPEFNGALLADLRTSLDLFLDDVVWRDERSDYRRLLLSNDIYVNDQLAKFLGASITSEQAGFRKVSFDPKQRCGVLTHPYLLAALAYSRESSPIHRGVFLTRNIVGRALRPPPQAVEFKDDRFDPSLTMRQKVTELTRGDQCMGCHAVINPLGFSLEQFDAVGRFRTTDKGKPVDTISEFPVDLGGKTVRLTGPRDVAEFAASSPEAHRSFVRHLFQHVVKQPPEAFGPSVLENLRTSFANANFNVQSLLVEIARVSALRGATNLPAADRRATEPGKGS
jgi:mono/diheme cytochrome c family protein